MGITHPFNRARAFVHAQSGPDRQHLRTLCQGIQHAQSALQVRAQPYLRQCRHCSGLCCRRIHVESIVYRPDIIYILTMAPQMEAVIQSCLQHPHGLYAADCIFLENGVGPCLFPPTVRPLICIASFCFDTPKLGKSIQRLKRKFLTLQFWIWKQDMRLRWQGVKNAVRREADIG
jgi:hypothetical protein